MFDDRKLTYEITQCRSALSNNDVKLAQLKQQLTAAKTHCNQAAAEVNIAQISLQLMVICEFSRDGKWLRKT